MRSGVRKLTWAMLSQLPVCQLAAQLAVPATPSRKLPARVALARKPMSHTAYTAVDDMLKGRMGGMAARSGIAGWAAEAVLGINEQQRGTGLCQGPAPSSMSDPGQQRYGRWMPWVISAAEIRSTSAS